MIELNLIKGKDCFGDCYEQRFSNGFVSFHLDKTPTSKVYNHCRVEFGADIMKNYNGYNNQYRAFDASEFRTEEAFERGKNWVLPILNKYEYILMMEKEK